MQNGTNTSYTFEVYTNDGKKYTDEKLVGLLNSILFGDDSHKPDSEVGWTASEKIQNYITQLREKIQKEPSGELKKELEILNNITAIAVISEPYQSPTHHV